MECADRSQAETFKYPLALKILLGGGEVGAIVFVVLLVLVKPPNPTAFWIQQCIAFASGMFALAMIPVLLRLPEKIHTDDRSITYEAPNGERTSLAWEQVVRVVDKPLSQHMEVHGQDGFTVIRIENQIGGFGRLREIVLDRTMWEDKEDIPALPATFSRPTPSLITLFGIAVVLTVFGIALASVDKFPGLVLVLLGVGCVSDWLLIRVNHSELTFQHLFWKRKIPLDQIEDVRMETYRPGHGHAFLAISIRLRNGKSRRIYAVRGGSLNLYKTLMAAIKSDS